MKTKTSELTGAALDWAVAQALGYDIVDEVCWKDEVPEFNLDCFSPSEVWQQGGPIIERKLIATEPHFKAAGYETPTGEWYWQAKMPSEDGGMQETFYGPTPLIAAMRCYCASKLGDEVDVPAGLAA